MRKNELYKPALTRQSAVTCLSFGPHRKAMYPAYFSVTGATFLRIPSWLATNEQIGCKGGTDVLAVTKIGVTLRRWCMSIVTATTEDLPALLLIIKKETKIKSMAVLRVGVPLLVAFPRRQRVRSRKRFDNTEAHLPQHSRVILLELLSNVLAVNLPRQHLCTTTTTKKAAV